VRILTINCGSSTLKFELFEMAEGERSLARGVVDRIGGPGSAELSSASGERTVRSIAAVDHGEATLQAIQLLGSSGFLGGLEAGGHRVVHDGARFSGPVRNPQYDGFILIMVGFLLQWPTLLTLVMFPILVMMYVRLARREEREVREAFGEEYARYAATTPAFFPRPGFVRPNRA
jgi:hypothetical protein